MKRIFRHFLILLALMDVSCSPRIVTVAVHAHHQVVRHLHLRAPSGRVCHHLHARHDIHSRDFPCHIHSHHHRRPPQPQHREQTHRPLRPGKNPRKAGNHPSHQGNPRPRRGAQTLHPEMGLVRPRLGRPRHPSPRRLSLAAAESLMFDYSAPRGDLECFSV